MSQPFAACCDLGYQPSQRDLLRVLKEAISGTPFEFKQEGFLAKSTGATHRGTQLGFAVSYASSGFCLIAVDWSASDEESEISDPPTDLRRGIENVRDAMRRWFEGR